MQATRLADVAADTALTPGRYAMGFSSDQADAPMALIDVPAGYRGGGDGYEIAAEEDGIGFRHFGTWTVAEVAAQPCGDTAWVDPGPSVDDLADALAALPVWESTQPAPRTIGGHEGVFMELNVPADIPAKCQGEPLSWRDHLGGTQGIGPGKTQHLWIVGRRRAPPHVRRRVLPRPRGPHPQADRRDDPDGRGRHLRRRRPSRALTGSPSARERGTLGRPRTDGSTGCAGYTRGSGVSSTWVWSRFGFISLDRQIVRRPASSVCAVVPQTFRKAFGP